MAPTKLWHVSVHSAIILLAIGVYSNREAYITLSNTAEYRNCMEKNGIKEQDDMTGYFSGEYTGYKIHNLLSCLIGREEFANGTTVFRRDRILPILKRFTIINSVTDQAIEDANVVCNKIHEELSDLHDVTLAYVSCLDESFRKYIVTI